MGFPNKERRKQEGSEGVLGSGNSLSNEWRQDGGRVLEEQCVLRLCDSKRIGEGEKGS